MSDDEFVLHDVRDEIMRELAEDGVELWVVARSIRDALPNASDDRVRDIASGVLDALLAQGAEIGDLDETSGVFSPWVRDDRVEHAMRAWQDLGRDPTIGEIGWIAVLD